VQLGEIAAIMNPEDFRKNIRKWESLRDDGTISEAACQREIDRLFAAMRGDEHGAHGVASPFPPVGTQVGGRAVQEGEILETSDASYSVGEMIGSGSYGEVYLATNTTMLEPYGLSGESDIDHIRQTLDAQGKGTLARRAIVAIKLLRPEHTQYSHHRNALEHESDQLSKVQHHGVVELIGGLHTDRRTGATGRQFIVMEYIVGESLKAAIERRSGLSNPWGLSEAVNLVYQIADVLQYLYQWPGGDRRPLRLLHRDIKPANVMLVGESVASPPEQRPIKLVDFGLAGKARDSGTLHVGSTAEMGVYAPPGSDGYLAPELTRAATCPAHPQQDLYSLAVLYYSLHAIGGRLPYSSSGRRRATDKHCPPEGLCSEEGDLPIVRAQKAALLRELDRALSYDPARRHENSWEFAECLKRAIQASEETIKNDIRHPVDKQPTARSDSCGARESMRLGWRNVRLVPRSTVGRVGALVVMVDPITWRDWFELVGRKPLAFAKRAADWFDDDRPATCLSAQEVQELIEALNQVRLAERSRASSAAFRLMTIDEWLHIRGAARFGANGVLPDAEQAVFRWSEDKRSKATNPVRPTLVTHDSNQFNEWGLRGCFGNVRELVLKDEARQQFGAMGGGFDASPADLVSTVCRDVAHRSDDVGVRLARPLLPSELNLQVHT